MAVLAADRNTPRRRGATLSVPVKAATKIYAGSLVCKAAAGGAEPGKKAAGLIALGRAEELADNSSGALGEIIVRVRRGTFQWDNADGAGAIEAEDIGAKAYMLDDQTVTKAAAGASAAGVIAGVDAGGVWVETR